MTPHWPWLTLALGLGACTAARQAAPPPGPMPISGSRVDTFQVVMPSLQGRERTVRVYLPKGYDGGRTRYPVLYLQDGQNLFRAGYFGDWRVDETLDEMLDDGRIPGLIVVGIDSG